MESPRTGRAIALAVTVGAVGVLAASGRPLAGAAGTIEAAARQFTVRLAAQNVSAPELRDSAGLTPGEALLFNGWGITPAGSSVLTTDMPLKMALSPDGRTLALAHGGYNAEGLTLIDAASRKLLQFIPMAAAWNGIAFSADGKTIFVSGGASGKVARFQFLDGKAALQQELEVAAPGPNCFLTGLAVHPRTGRVYVCNEGADQVLVLDPDTGKVEEKLAAGSYPHSLVFAQEGRHLYVSDWGGRSVTLLNLPERRRLREIGVGVRPNDMTLAPDGRLFVACAGDNTVHVLDTNGIDEAPPPPKPQSQPPGVTPQPEAGAVIEIISTALYPSSPEGSTPSAVAVSPAESTLYAANADNNDIACIDIHDRTASRVRGFIPVGWYPTAVAASADGRVLYVANGKGLRFRGNVPPTTSYPVHLFRPPAFDYIGHMFQGSVSFIPRPSESELARYTEQVRRNCPYQPDEMRAAATKSHGPIPDRLGGSCPIKYVLYIIKENRTYDQVFGDFRDASGRSTGNGDPRLVMFGEGVTPNHHQIARDYVLLDNLYCNGEVSVDGHSWCDAAIATDYNERAWIQSYSGHGKLPGNQEMMSPSSGFLWDLCRRAGLSYRSYGEASEFIPSENRGRWRGKRDAERVDDWIADLHEAEKSGELPRFTIMSLGEDHTSGTRPGRPTPEASVASNDVALGKIVEAASRSRFWPQLAIFVIEDDAQNGPDHMDAHRTAGLVISPWCRRHFVDSTMYSTASMVRTIELILGLPPLTQYDAGATPMFNCFQSRPVVTAYRPASPKVNLLAVNPPTAPGARESLRMDFEGYDRAPEDDLNGILWRAVKGPAAPYPAPVHRALLFSRIARR
jgi:YVTN family beta-propeller protein